MKRNNRKAIGRRSKNKRWSRQKSKTIKKMPEALKELVKRKAERMVADRRAGKAITICRSRTVELLQNEQPGSEREKLLFVLSLGLIPNGEGKMTEGPRVLVEKLNPDVEAESRATTKEAVRGVCRQKFGYFPTLDGNRFNNSKPSLPVSQEPGSNDNFDTVVLSSDEDDDIVEILPPTRSNYNRQIKLRSGSRFTPNFRKPLFKSWSNKETFGDLNRTREDHNVSDGAIEDNRLHRKLLRFVNRISGIGEMQPES